MATGIITNKQNGDPLPYVNIALIGKNKGTASNAEGRFSFTMANDDMSDTVQFSCIGYHTLQIPVDQFTNSHHIIQLSPSFISLQEIVIRNVNPTRLINDVLLKQHLNYPSQPFMQKYYYREAIKRKEKLLNFSEAILETYKTGYKPYALKDQIHLIKGRYANTSSKTDTISLKLKAGIQTILDLDVIKYGISFLQEEYLQNYTYSLIDMVIDKERLYYQIAFEPTITTNNYIPYKGDLLIDIKNMGIRRVRFNIPHEILPDAATYFIYRDNPRLKLKVLEAQYEINYQLINNKYYLQSVLLGTKFKIRIKPNWTSDIYQLATQAEVISTDTINVSPIPRKHRQNTNVILSDEIELNKTNYWEEYNYIKPEVTFEEVINKSKVAGSLYPL